MQSNVSGAPGAPMATHSVEDEIVDLLVSWGAVASPEGGDLLRALSGAPTIADLLRGLQNLASDLLPPQMQEELKQVARLVDAGGSLGAPSLRARIDRILRQSRDHLDPGIVQLGRSIAANLSPWALILDRQELDQTLQTLWRGERPGDLAERLNTLEGMQDVQRLLEDRRRSLEADLHKAASTAAGGEAGAGAGAAAQARQALEEGDPLRLYQAKAALESSRDLERTRASATTLQEARRRLADLVARARQQATAPEPGPHGELETLRAGMIESAARFTDGPSPDRGEEVEALRSAVEAWERALTGILEHGSQAAAAGDEKRLDLVRSYEAEIGVLQSRSSALSGPTGDTFTAQASQAMDALRESAPGGGPPLEQALQKIDEIVRSGRESTGAGLQSVADRISVSSAHLTTLLEKSGDKLPTATVFNARLHLEQVEGLIAARDIAALTTLEKLMEDDIAELRRLLSIVQRRHSNRLEAERETCLEEISRLSEVAPPRVGRSLRAVANEVEQCERDALAPLQTRVERLGDRVRQSIRLEAGKALYAANRWLKKAGDRPALSERVAALTEQVDELSRLLVKGKLPLLREQTVAVRAAVRKNAPLTRPAFRLGIAGLLVLALLAGAFAARSLWNKPQTYVFELDSEPAEAVEIWLVRNGRIIEKQQYGAGDPAVSFSLEEGRYEVFVNERYTGRVVLVPDDPREVTGIPILPAY